MNLDGLTIDELDDLMIENKRGRQALRDGALAIRRVRDRKILERDLGQRLGIDVAGLKPETLADLLATSRRTERPGDVTVEPGPGDLYADTHPAEAR